MEKNKERKFFERRLVESGEGKMIVRPIKMFFLQNREKTWMEKINLIGEEQKCPCTWASSICFVFVYLLIFFFKFLIPILIIFFFSWALVPLLSGFFVLIPIFFFRHVFFF